MTMTIRHLHESDWEAYRSLRLGALAEAVEAFASSADEQSNLTPLDWQATLRSDEYSFVLGAFTDDALVGMVSLVREHRRKTRHKAMVRGLYVTPAARGQGAARLLMDTLLREARAIPGLEQLALGVIADNVPARALYEQLGFVAYGREPRTLKLGDRYLDDELMILFLREPGSE